MESYSRLSPFPSYPFMLVFLALGVAWAASELFLGRFGVGTGSRASDRWSATVIALSIAAGATIANIEIRLGLAPIEVTWVRWFGLVVMAGGLALRVFAILWLGPMFTRVVQIVPGHRLVTTGPYRFVRHPSYTGMLLIFAGIGLALGSWLSLVALVVFPALGIAYRIRVEERTLLSAFGEEYKGYMERVRRLVPFLL
jgi:protein-S-isoprenylcysteine O-methyltransferase